MGWFRFAHEAFGMVFIALLLMRMYLFFAGNRWEGWRRYVPLRAAQWKEMMEVTKFYLFINPKPVSKIGHNAMAAFSYIGSVRFGAGRDPHRTGDVQLAAAQRRSSGRWSAGFPA